MMIGFNQFRNNFVQHTLYEVIRLLANSLSEAFEKLEVKGEIKAAYSDSNFLGASESEDITALGGSLGIVTGDFYGLSAGVTFQASTVLTDDFNAVTAGPRITSYNVCYTKLLRISPV